MACAQGIRQNIEQAKEYYRKQRQYDPYQELWKHLKAKEMATGFESFTKAEKLYAAVVAFDGEVYNGGIQQFFENSSGELYAEAIEGLSVIKAVNSLSLLKRAAEILFGEIEPPKDHDQRYRAMRQPADDDNAPKPDWVNELDELDDEYYKDLDKLAGLLAEYAETTGLLEPFKVKAN